MTEQGFLGFLLVFNLMILYAHIHRDPDGGGGGDGMLRYIIPWSNNTRAIYTPLHISDVP